MGFTGFSDLAATDNQLEQDTRATSKQERFTCQKCAGTGNYQGIRVHQEKSNCFACKGKGYFLTDPRNRAKAKARREAKKTEKLNAIRDQFKAYRDQHEELFTFMVNNSNWNDFFASMLDAASTYGKLTEKQEAAAYKCMEKCVASRAKKQAEKNAAATSVDLTKLHDVFHTAVANGLKKPKLRMAGLLVSLAPATGRNEGCLYVKQDGEYQGKLTPEGKFFTVRGAAEGIEQTIAEFCKDPLEAAKMYGKETGTCACCGRELTDPNSIALGIGPVCADNWF